MDGRERCSRSGALGCPCSCLAATGISSQKHNADQWPLRRLDALQSAQKIELPPRTMTLLMTRFGIAIVELIISILYLLLSSPCRASPFMIEEQKFSRRLSRDEGKQRMTVLCDCRWPRRVYGLAPTDSASAQVSLSLSLTDSAYDSCSTQNTHLAEANRLTD